MSEVAGRLAPQAGAYFLEAPQRWARRAARRRARRAPGRVVVLGAGNVGWNAAWIAAGMEAEVILLDKNLDRLRWVDQIHKGRIMTLASNQGAVERAVAEADLVIGAVLVAGGRAPVVVSEAMVAAMKRGAVIVDVAVDQGGCIETTHETTHNDPVYEIGGVIHYAVGNMPGAVPHTSTYALTNATLPYVLDVAAPRPGGGLPGRPGPRLRLQHRRRPRHQRAGRRVPRRRLAGPDGRSRAGVGSAHEDRTQHRVLTDSRSDLVFPCQVRLEVRQLPGSLAALQSHGVAVGGRQQFALRTAKSGARRSTSGRTRSSGSVSRRWRWTAGCGSILMLATSRWPSTRANGSMRNCIGVSAHDVPPSRTCAASMRASGRDASAPSVQARSPVEGPTVRARKTKRVIHGTIGSMFRAAVADGILARSPSAGVKAPKVERPRVIPLTIEQVEALYDATPERFRALVVLGAGCGLRVSEALALTEDRIDWLRRRIVVDRQLVDQEGGGVTFGPPKTPKSNRVVPVADVVGVELAEHVRVFGTNADGLLFHDERGRRLDRRRVSEWWRPAARQAGLDGRTFHDLRHCYASLLIAAGASVKAVQEALGHSSAVETLDTYSHLWPSDQERLAKAVDQAWRAKVAVAQ